MINTRSGVKKMDYISVRELRSAPKQIWDKLAQDGRLVLTNNGKPQALMLAIDGSTIDETLVAFEQAETMRLLNSIHLDSVKKGTDTMSLEEINAEIAATRTERS
jgi:hypothetical protein